MALSAEGLAQDGGEELPAVGVSWLLLLLEQSGRDFSAFGLSQHEGSPSLVVRNTGVCAAVQQQPDQVRLTPGRGEGQGGETLTVLGVDPDLPVQQQFSHVSMTVPGGMHQRGPAGVVPNARGRSLVQQQRVRLTPRISLG